MNTAMITLASLAASLATSALAYDNPEAAYPYNHTTVVEETYVPDYSEPASPSEVRGYSVKADKQAWESERYGKSGSDGSVDAFQRTDPGHVKSSRSGPDTNR